jgi:hypothetical protein
MKALLLWLMSATQIAAAPYLVSDAYPPQSDPTNDVVAFAISGLTDGAPIISNAVTDSDGSQYLQFDLGPLHLVAGSYVLTVTAIDAKGQKSAPAPFVLKWLTH